MRTSISVLGLLLGAFLISSANAEKDDDTLLEHASYTVDKTFVSCIKGDALRKCPEWLESAENPPVSVRKAMAVADAKMKKLVHDTKDYKWRRESVSLKRIEDTDVESSKQSYWHVRYEAHGRDGETGPGPELDLFVLMDGKLVQPEVTEGGYGK